MKLKSKILIILSIIFILIENICYADEFETTELKFNIFDTFDYSSSPYSAGDEFSFFVDNTFLDTLRADNNLLEYGFVFYFDDWRTDYPFKVVILKDYPYYLGVSDSYKVYGDCYNFSSDNNVFSSSCLNRADSNINISFSHVYYTNSIYYTSSERQEIRQDYSESKNIFLEETNEEPIVEPIEEPSENNTITEISITDEQFSEVNEKLSNILDIIEFISSAVLGYCIYSFLHNLLERRKV